MDKIYYVISKSDTSL